MQASMGGGGASTGAAATIWADPAALERFSRGGASRTTGLTTARAALVSATDAWNAADNEAPYGFCLEDFSGDIDDLGRAWTSVDGFVGEVAQAFRDADDASTGGTTVFATQGAVDKAMADNLKDYNPIKSISDGDADEWARLTGANICYTGGGKYTGGGFITAPDGSRYPLVIAETKDGYNADDGGRGDVNTQDGHDPGWFQTGIYSGERQLFPVDKTSAIIGGILVGATGGSGLPNKSASTGEYKNLVTGDGRPKYYGDGKVPYKTPGGIGGLRDLSYDHNGNTKAIGLVNPAPTRGAAKGMAALLPLNAASTAVSSVDNARKDAYGKYQLITERNLDGRVRARLTIYQMAHGDDGKQIIIPAGVTREDGHLKQTVIKYRPHVDTGDPVADDDPKGDHVYKGMKDASLFGVFGSWKEPTFQDP